jgi:hypothetical protein
MIPELIYFHHALCRIRLNRLFLDLLPISGSLFHIVCVETAALVF